MFHGGNLLPQADLVISPGLPPETVVVSGLGCDSLSSGCNGNPVYYNLTSSVATAVIAPAVPEPSTWAMLLIGFAGIGYVARRGRHQFPKPAGGVPA
jgi:hypothetical protein